MNREHTALVGTLGLGAITGIRSLAGPTFALRALTRDSTGAGLFDWVAGTHAVAISSVLAVLEAVADKASILPARSRPLPLAGRAMCGALVGALTARRTPLKGALLGAAAAAATALLAVRLRSALTSGEHSSGARVPDFVVGLLEDATVSAAGLGLLQMLRAEQRS